MTESNINKEEIMKFTATVTKLAPQFYTYEVEVESGGVKVKTKGQALGIGIAMQNIDTFVYNHTESVGMVK